VSDEEEWWDVPVGYIGPGPHPDLPAPQRITRPVSPEEFMAGTRGGPPGRRITTGWGRSYEDDPIEAPWIQYGDGPRQPLGRLTALAGEPPEHRVCRERTDDEQGALDDDPGAEECEDCGEDLSGGTSHYHCDICGEVCSVMGHDHRSDDGG
jgi:hypothetical protein